MSSVRLIAVPYHDGLAGIDRARGPLRLLEAAGVGSFEILEPVDPAAPEAARVFELARRLAGRVRAAIADGAFPLVLAGDCNSCLGTVAGCGSHDLGVAWFDAHADFDTPDDNLSGSLDAMALAFVTGHGWRALRESVPGLAPIDEGNVVLAGARDFERASGIGSSGRGSAGSKAAASATPTCGLRSPSCAAAASTCTSISTRSTRRRESPTSTAPAAG